MTSGVSESDKMPTDVAQNWGTIQSQFGHNFVSVMAVLVARAITVEPWYVKLGYLELPLSQTE